MPGRVLDVRSSELCSYPSPAGPQAAPDKPRARMGSRARRVRAIRANSLKQSVDLSPALRKPSKPFIRPHRRTERSMQWWCTEDPPKRDVDATPHAQKHEAPAFARAPRSTSSVSRVLFRTGVIPDAAA